MHPGPSQHLIQMSFSIPRVRQIVLLLTIPRKALAERGDYRKMLLALGIVANFSEQLCAI